MTQFIDPKKILTATDTWSGFIYQVKLAIYHMLKLINKKSFNDIELSYEDIFFYNKIIVALTETDKLMKEIDNNLKFKL
ncbi:hypothetical protein [Faecalibacter macacae]|uniref:Uncharacterized protein n=1 Tax=Faecalibacter macacae TaxID=1859289 RepID=A0A3L9M4G6_9FLAO|nr:hypothetical protein [Faecalibacter macacae]RLZ08040.1 hypothetical protein EAH69_10605 [Faecalibacter macacae]